MKPLRCQRLRDAAQDCPQCMACGVINHGQIVACHPNSLRYGKGMGQKSHDLMAYLCNDCHDQLDGRVGKLNRQEKDAMFQDAFYWSTVWLIQSGRLVAK